MAAPTPPSPWRRLRDILATERQDLWVVLLYGITVGLLALVVPVAAQAVVNTAAFGTVLQPVLVLSLVVLGTLLLAGLFQALEIAAAELIQQRIFARMAVDLAHRLPRTQVDVYDAERGTALVNRFMDVMTIQKSTALILLDGVGLAMQTAVGVVLLALYHPILLGFDVFLLAGMGLVLFVLGRGAVRTSVEESYAKYAVVTWLEELARTPLAFKSPGGPELALRRADALTGDYLSRRRRHFHLLMRQIVGSLGLQAVASALLLGLGAWLVSQRQMTLGQLVAAELVVTPVVASFARFGKYLETGYDLLAAVDKVGHLFDLPLEAAALPLPAPGASGPAGLRLVDVRYEYPGRAPSLRDVTLQLAPGSRVALLGPNGSGKSTLVDVAVGLRTPTQGAVELDGVDLRNVAPAWRRSQVALVRGIDLFDGTLLDNLTLGREGLGLHEVREALAAVGLLDELMRLPQGLSTPVSGSHFPLSTGQTQRLVLARALMGRPRLMVLDESLDTLDRESRQKVADALFAPGAPWTLLLTTHVSEMTTRCDRVLRIEQGRLVAEERA